MKNENLLYHKIIAAKLFIDEYYHKSIGLHEIARNACLLHFISTGYSQKPITAHHTDISHKNSFNLHESCLMKTN
jgi:hypothetical protein